MDPRWLIVTVSLSILVEPASRAEEAERAPLALTQGEQRLLRIPRLSRYSLGNPSIARVLASPAGTSSEHLLIKGVAPGWTDLWVWKSDGSVEHRTIRIDRWKPEERAGIPKALERAVQSLQEVEVLHSSQGFLLQGEVRSWAEARRLSALAQGFPDQIRLETEPALGLVEQGESRLKEWIQSRGFAGRVHLERVGRHLKVLGSFSNPGERSAAEQGARNAYPLAEVRLDSPPDASPTIYFRVYLLELNRSRFRSLGLDWPSEAMSAFRVTPWNLQESLRLDLTLRALEGEGSARILSRPELVVRAPGEAELLSGGELPIRIRTRTGYTVIWKPFGLQLKLKVTHVTADRARLEIETESSQIDSKLSISEVPGLQTNRMRTQVDARFGTPLLLSGLLQESSRHQNRGLPVLRRFPLLGSAFGSSDESSQRSELVAILVPQLSPPTPPDLEPKPSRPPSSSPGPAPAPAAAAAVAAAVAAAAAAATETETEPKVTPHPPYPHRSR